MIVRDSRDNQWMYVCMKGQCNIIKCVTMDHSERSNTAAVTREDYMLTAEFLHNQRHKTTAKTEGIHFIFFIALIDVRQYKYKFLSYGYNGHIFLCDKEQVHLYAYFFRICQECLLWDAQVQTKFLAEERYADLHGSWLYQDGKNSLELPVFSMALSGKRIFVIFC